MSVVWLAKDELMPTIKKVLKPVNIVMDIGCGIGPQAYFRPNVHICCEPFDEYIRVLQKKIELENDRHYIIIKATWQEVVNIFPLQSVDTIILSDVIEHLEKEEAKRLLTMTENIARIQIAVFTPLGFLPQKHPDGIDNWNLHGADWQEHRSGWLPEDFDPSWEIFASKEYHFADPKGNVFPRPFGAFWAVKNLSKSRPVFSKRIKIHLWVDKIINSWISLRGRFKRRQ